MQVCLQVFSLPALSSCFKLGANVMSEGAALSMQLFISMVMFKNVCVWAWHQHVNCLSHHKQIKRSDLPAFTQTLKVTLNHYSPFTYPQNNMWWLAEAMTEETLPLCV